MLLCLVQSGCIPPSNIVYAIWSFWIALVHRMCHMLYIAMWSVILCILCFTYSGCFSPSDMSYVLYCYAHRWFVGVFFACVLRFILTFPFGLRSLIRYVISSCPHVMCSFILCVICFTFVLSIHISIFDLFFYHVSYVLFCLVHSDCFLHSMFYILYSAMYSQDMFFFPCNMFSVCSVYPLIWGVLSTRRIKCTITNCLKSTDVIRYASSQTS